MKYERVWAQAMPASSQGFTLIELMIAVGLGALLLSLAIPALDQFTTTNLRTTVCASANGANCEAVTWDQGWIVFTDRDSDQTVDNGETIVATSAGIDGLSIQSGEFGQFLMYRPNGRVMTSSANGNSGQFTVCDNRGSDFAKVLIVDLSGRPRMSKYLADGTSPSCS